MMIIKYKFKYNKNALFSNNNTGHKKKERLCNFFDFFFFGAEQRPTNESIMSTQLNIPTQFFCYMSSFFFFYNNISGRIYFV